MQPDLFIVGDILRTVVKFWRHSVSHHAAVQTFADFLILIDLSVNDQCSVRWQQGCKLMKGVTDIFQIFKEIQMIGFNVQDDADLREKCRKLFVYSQASVTKMPELPTRIFPPMACRIPPTEMVGSVSPASRT